ncbi:MAG: hypothetical protein ACRD0O_01560 [Acidimicrobiia bacterium]
MTVDPGVLGKALGARLAEVQAAMSRYDAFAYRPDEASRGDDEQAGDGEQPGDPGPAARDFVLVALATAADPLSYTLLRRMAGGDATLAELGAAAGLPRLAVWERLANLVAAGLAGRSLEADTAGLTPAGAALVELVEEATAAASAEARG